MAEGLEAAQAKAQRLTAANDRRIEALELARQCEGGFIFVPDDDEVMVNGERTGGLQQLETGRRLKASDLALMGVMLSSWLTSVVAGSGENGFTADLLKNQLRLLFAEDHSPEMLEQCAETLKGADGSALVFTPDAVPPFVSKKRPVLLTLVLGFLLAEHRMELVLEEKERDEDAEQEAEGSQAEGGGGGGVGIVEELLIGAIADLQVTDPAALKSRASAEQVRRRPPSGQLRALFFPQCVLLVSWRNFSG